MFRQPSGVTAIEYVIIVVVIAAVLWSVLKGLFQATATKYNDVGARL